MMLNEPISKIMTTAGFHSLPVVEDGAIVGIVTTTDIIQYVLDHL